MISTSHPSYTSFEDISTDDSSGKRNELPLSQEELTHSGSTVEIGERQAQDSEERLEDVDTVDADADAADDTKPSTSGRYGLKAPLQAEGAEARTPFLSPITCPLHLPHTQPHPFPFALFCTDAHSARSSLHQRPGIMRHLVAVLVVEDDLDECNDLLAWDSLHFLYCLTLPPSCSPSLAYPSSSVVQYHVQVLVVAAHPAAG